MEIVFVLLPVSLLLIGIAIAFFVRAVNSGQFDDLDRQGYEILFDRDKDKDRDKDRDRDKEKIPGGDSTDVDHEP